MGKKQVRVCHFHKISIRKTGDVFPCCLARPNTRLGNIFDDDIVEQIENKSITCECELFKCRDKQEGEKPHLKHLHLEFSNECQARCVCCPQHKETLENEELHLQKLTQIIEKYMPENITVIGGEVLIQQKTLNWLVDVKKKYPQIKFDIVTNLCVKEEILEKAKNLFDFMTVSILGFSQTTYNSIMGLDFDRTFKNIDSMFNSKKVNMRLKYLLMPTNLYEAPNFFKWALGKQPFKIYLHSIHEFKQIANTETIYWQKSFEELEKEIKKILEENKEEIIAQNRNYISIHRNFADFCKIDDNYLKQNGFENIIKITS